MRVALLVCALFGAMPAARGQILRDNFGTGDSAPAGWVLREGSGAWEPAAGGRRFISVSGTGEDTSHWARQVPELKPNSVYSLRFRAKADSGSSPYTLISGLDVCNRDFGVSDTWQNYGFAFRTPSDVSSAFLRLGQWHLKGRIVFSDVALYEATPLHREVRSTSGSVPVTAFLGSGEAINRATYSCVAPLADQGSNDSRCLVSHTAPFNSNRWVFSGGLEVVYKHSVRGVKQLGGAVTINVNYRTGGECIVYAGTDGKDWIQVGRLAELGSRTLRLPESLYPTDEVYVKLSGASASELAGNSAPGAFQIDAYRYVATVPAGTPDAHGATVYVETLRTTPGLRAEIETLGDLGIGPSNAARLRLLASGSAAGEVAAIVRIEPMQGSGKALIFSNTARLQAGRSQAITVPYSIGTTGHLRLTISAVKPDPRRPTPLYAASADVHVPAYFATDYGHSLTPVLDGELWWCEGTYKVPHSRLPPSQEFGADLADLKAVRGKGAITMSAARREREHAQLIFRPDEDPGPITVSVSDLVLARSGRSARIEARNIEVRQVDYVNVTQPTDRTGVAGPWPDPLSPLDGVWKPRVGRNNPLWITVTVPPDAPAGQYTGIVTLAARKWKREVELRVRVWDFALPERTALRSGFGVQPDIISRYHNLRSPGSLEKVWDMYMEAFRSRRIAPYNPMALAPYRLSLEGRTWMGGTREIGNAGAGSASLRISDASTNADINAGNTTPVPIQPGTRYILSWKCRTAVAQQAYLVTVAHLDANRQWMWGRNNDIARVGTGGWDTEFEDITDRIPPDARYVTVTLRPCLWTETGGNTGVAWFDDIELRAADGGENLIPGGDFEAEPTLDLRIDFTDFDRAAERYLDGLGFNAFTIHIEGLPGGRYPNHYAGSFMGYSPDTPEYDALMTRYGRLLEDHLESKGWLKKAYVYWYDEPEENDYPIVVDGAARLKRYFPRLKRMMTEQFEEPLFGSVDLWCPITPTYNRQRAQARQKLGEEVWWYVCTGPKEPFCTLFIDHSAIELRMWLWQTWQRSIEGILIWETTWWTSPQQFRGAVVQNPWEDPMAYVADAAGVWGNGDGRFFYPPNRDPNGDRATEFISGPVISIRWEMLGDGIEDWEYFRLLDQAVKRAAASGARANELAAARSLLRVPPSITSDLTRFTTDPQLLFRHREAIARQIEALQSPRNRAPRPQSSLRTGRSRTF